MTIEQEQKCAIEALSRASDVTQRLMFREGAKWMDSEHAAALAKAEERCREVTEEKEAMRIAWHGLINQGKDFYSWQRDWQDAARLVLGLGEDASVEDINSALLLRNEANGRES